jgi:hypothetical protein
MAAQIMGTDLSVRIPQQTEIGTSEHAREEIGQDDGSAFRGFFFAMLFNLFLLITGIAGWELWRLIR